MLLCPKGISPRKNAKDCANIKVNKDKFWRKDLFLASKQLKAQPSLMKKQPLTEISQEL